MTTADAPQTHAQYVFLDVEDFTKGRSIEGQREIIRFLNSIVKDTVQKCGVLDENVIYMPAGDGICAAIIDPKSTFDIHMQIAVGIIRSIHEHNESASVDEPKFKVRIGINESNDNLIKDINGNPNMAGSGINNAQRIMSVADGGQIIVGQAAYDTLHVHKMYINEGTFVEHPVIVKHDTEMRVYQYIGKDVPGLNIEQPKSIIKGDAALLHQSAKACGLDGIYYSRDEVKKSVLRDIEGARHRVWISSVGLSETISLDDVLSSLHKNQRKLRFKVLLLDALRSTALFRTFLEIPIESFREIIDANRDKEMPPEEPYFLSPLYNAFRSGYAKIRGRRDLYDAVRFYGHTPMCWLIIVDDTAYFQPYTFGRSKNADPKNRTLGPLMPVFKFKKHDKAGTNTFGILEDHFNKLWSTTDIDLLHVGPRILEENLILKHIFKRRLEWFRYSYEVLSKAPNDDRRRYPRKPCGSTPPPSIFVRWEIKEGGQSAEAKIENFSREGILLTMNSGKVPGDEIEIVTLTAKPVKPHDATQYVIDEVIKPCKGKFIVKRINSTMVALQAYYEEE